MPPETESRRVVTGQKVDKPKLELAKLLRRKMTPEEKLLWARLRSNRLEGLHFRRQQIISGFIADFYCDKAGVVVEVDGGIHLYTLEYDRERSKVFESRGLRILRVTNEEVANNIIEVLDRITKFCGLT